MSSKNKPDQIDIKALLSTLWIFFLLNVIFRDIHEFFRPGLVAEMMTGTVNGTPMTEELFLVAGIMLQIPLAMVVLSRVLKYSANRWANMIIPVITAASLLSNGVNDLDDIFFAAVEVATLALIAWLAWRWQEQEDLTTRTTT